MGRALGIDLGTTNSVMAVIEKGRPVIIPNAEGDHLTPSVVAYDSRRGIIVGKEARKQASVNPENTVISIKRKMGKGQTIPFNGEPHTPEQISSYILSRMKRDAERFLGCVITDAVITVPAYFDDRQRQATKRAGEYAGFHVLRIINEPTSAALAYGLGRQNSHRILIWDLGGGTFDVSILEMGQGVYQVKAVNGNTALGGDDWDLRLMDYIRNQVQARAHVDLRADPCWWQMVRELSESAKITLSDCEKTVVTLSSIPCEALQNLSIPLTRALFEELTHDLRERMVAPTMQALDDAGIFPCDIDKVVLVGGSTRMPAVRQMVEDLLFQPPFTSLNPDEVVALGAALQAGLLAGDIDAITLIDVTPLSLGIETMGSVCTKIIPRNTIIPTSRGQIFTTAEDNQTSIDVHVLQGERPMAADNISLGTFILHNIEPLPRGTSQVEVIFMIDVSGILEVRACDLQTEEEQRTIISTKEELSEEKIARLIGEAHANNQRDRREERRARILIQARNTKDATVHFITERGELLKQASVQALKAQLKSLARAVFTEDLDGAEKIIKSLARELEALGTCHADEKELIKA